MTAKPSVLSASSQAAEVRSSGFGMTTLDTLMPGDAGERRPASVFDVCHAGVVLRTLLAVEAAVALGVLFVAADFAAWLSRLAAASAVAVPAVLLWLSTACLLKRPLGALPPIVRWASAIGLGALSAAVPAMLVLPLGLDMLGAHPLLAPVIAGAVGAAAVYGWLQLRARTLLPAETTARLAELQSRIRPHFLFNTLNTALALVRVDPARAEGVLEDLAELFRVALTDIGESVSLAEEVELARRYLAIEQVRFGARLNIVWELDDEAGGARVPPLILQPLVENAVRHGVEPSPEGGTVRIRTRVKLGRVQVVIANTVPNQPSRPGSGMALNNVRERLNLMHDMAAQFETRRADGVFRVQLAVPL
ncbi:sensor histidine kinase [uncultured Piscinibacter sp.]|uniref:sensor histidine kinase n=1 Tax=uncultured Piscinibacter sp. TaxID=1131835 RepID=UPI0026265EE3|nr:histidine kinase [uncultured Piscinibacter sp.]